MARFICELQGVRGRVLRLYDTKCVIITTVTAVSFLTGNTTDGEKTIFLSDVVGVQFKRSGKLIGFLQFETPSIQMNNKDSNFFSENTFTFEHDKNGVTNEIVEMVYNFVVDKIEDLKYKTNFANEQALSVAIKAMNQMLLSGQKFECPRCSRQISYGNPRCQCGLTFDWDAM